MDTETTTMLYKYTYVNFVYPKLLVWYLSLHRQQIGLHFNDKRSTISPIIKEHLDSTFGKRLTPDICISENTFNHAPIYTVTFWTLYTAISSRGRSWWLIPYGKYRRLNINSVYWTIQCAVNVFIFLYVSYFHVCEHGSWVYNIHLYINVYVFKYI